jgi:hypothetical protein
MQDRSPDYPITGSPDSSCYTAPFPSMFHAALRCAALFALLSLAVPGLAQQEKPLPWQPAADDLVQQMLSRAGSPSAINLTFANLSSLTTGEQSAIKLAIMTDFRNAGVRLVKADFALAEVEITFSEDWRDYVWVAEIKQGPGSQVVIKRVPRLQKPGAPRANTFILKKSFIWQQDSALLDFYSDGQNLFVLEPEEVALYGNESGQWRLKQTLAISHDHPWPRDLRGKLEISGFQITAYLPGTLCTGTTTPPAIQCRPNDDPWVLDRASLSAFFSPTRNFFTGVLAGRAAGESVAPFFSAVYIQNGESRQWAFAGTDGRTRIFLNDLSAAAIVVNDWGSNLASVHSECGSGGQILATAPGDLNRADSIQAFEIEGRHDEPVSSTLDLSGPVLALWPGDPAQSAHAVVQSLTTGKFEAWNVSVACN